MFLVEKPSHVDVGWGLACEHVSAALKASLGRHGEDDEFIRLVGELAALSEDFNDAWARNVAPTRTGTFRFSTGETSSAELTYTLNSVSDGSGDSVVLWEPADEASALALQRVSPPEVRRFRED